jgi:hypothetical protein
MNGPVNYSVRGDTPWRFEDRASQFPRFLDDLVKQEFGSLLAATF